MVPCNINPEIAAEQVFTIWKKVNVRGHVCGKPPYKSEIARRIRLSKPECHPRIFKSRMSYAGLSLNNDRVVAYLSYTILTKAEPTIYEKQFIGLKPVLNYVQIKDIMVDPEYWGHGIGQELLEQTKAVARSNGLPVVADVKADNKKMKEFCRNNHASVDFIWKTPKTEMIRIRFF